ncbi:MAG: hypothetical protein HYW80_00410 [Parcubacteria group bacterium]|nr:hypothetical protein [Parcubacteria group bacterium]
MTRFDLFFKIGVIFALVQGLTIFIIKRLAGSEIQPLLAETSAFDLLTFAVYILLATILVFLLSRFSQVRKGLKIFWLAAIFSGLEIFLGTVLREDYALLITASLVAIYWKAPTISIHNLVLIFALPGIAALFGSQVPPVTVIVLLALFSIYDVIAVYGTGHMIRMAHTFMAEQIIPGVIISEKGVDPMQLVGEITLGKDFSILGTGDFVMPAILVASTAARSMLAGSLVAIFALAGLFLTHTLFFRQKERRPMPALPPIAGFAILGFFVSQFFLK